MYIYIFKTYNHRVRHQVTTWFLIMWHLSRPEYKTDKLNSTILLSNL